VPWRRDTLQILFSTTKGAVAAAALLLVDRGLLDLDAAVADYWPEFAAEGKERIPVRWLLSHRAGLPFIDNPVSIEEALAWTPECNNLARQAPAWEPGTRFGYHALTYGWLVGEVIRRVTGRTPGAFFAQEVAVPLELEFWIGLPDGLADRVSRLIMPTEGLSPEVIDRLPEEVKRAMVANASPNSLLNRALGFFAGPVDWNDPVVHAGEVPAANGIGTARSVAKLYASLIGEVAGHHRTLSSTVVDAARAEESSGLDAVSNLTARFGLGFQLSSPYTPLLGPGSFGHEGAGGSLGFADVDAGIGFGYAMNQFQIDPRGDRRSAALIDAVRRCV
jgi:CubicO group peptidase (beta-lactamase class C family)